MFYLLTSGCIFAVLVRHSSIGSNNDVTSDTILMSELLCVTMFSSFFITATESNPVAEAASDTFTASYLHHMYNIISQ